MNTLRVSGIIIIVTMVFLMAFSCPPVRNAGAQEVKSDLSSGIALMPYWLGRPDPGIGLQRKSILDCTLAELCYLEGNPLQDAARVMNEVTQTELENRFGEKVVPFATAERAYTLLDKEDTDTLRSIAVRFGKKLQVDRVLAGTLWRYRERRGRAMAAESPASVAFALFLVDVENGTILWEDAFDKTQEALTDNLFNAQLYLKGGFKWLTAREFAAHGVSELLQKIPY